jgi:hypothetical protein
MNDETEAEDSQELRWLVVKSMLEAFPTLRTKVKRYLMNE